MKVDAIVETRLCEVDEVTRRNRDPVHVELDLVVIAVVVMVMVVVVVGLVVLQYLITLTTPIVVVSVATGLGLFQRLGGGAVGEDGPQPMVQMRRFCCEALGGPRSTGSVIYGAAGRAGQLEAPAPRTDGWSLSSYFFCVLVLRTKT
jgi:hypothetical protein